MQRKPQTLFAIGSTLLWILACAGEEEPVTGVLNGLAPCTGVEGATTVLDFDGGCVDDLCVYADVTEDDLEAAFDLDSDCSDINGVTYCEADGYGMVYEGDGTENTVGGFRLTDGFSAADETSAAGVGATWQCFVDVMGDPDHIGLVPTDGGHWIAEMGWGELSDGTWQVWVLDYESPDDAEADGTPDEVRFWSVSGTPALDNDAVDTESTDTDSESATETDPDTFDTAR